MIKAGRLRHKVTIKKCKQTTDGQGGRTTDFSEVVGNRFMSIRRATSEEVFQAGRLESVITHMITARFTSLIDEKTQLVFRTRIFNVVSVDNVDELDRKLMIQALEAK